MEKIVKLKKYTQEMFDAFPIVGRYKQCPTGDYSNIKAFPGWCHFKTNSIFSSGSVFNEWCKFETNCIFGDNCDFGETCEFYGPCEFGDHCKFYCCQFKPGCIFGEECNLYCCFLNGEIFHSCNTPCDECYKDLKVGENAYYIKSKHVCESCFIKIRKDTIDRLNAIKPIKWNEENMGTGIKWKSNRTDY